MNTALPFFWSAVTLAVYAAARAAFHRWKFPLLHPSLLGIVITVAIVEGLGRPYAAYQADTYWIAWLLGPGVVAMAVPVWRLRTLFLARLPLVGAVVLGSLFFGFVSMAGMLWLLREPADVIAAGPLKSITSPVALELGRQIGVRPNALVAAVLLAGTLGTVGPTVLRALGVRDRRARGLALGCGSHGIGVARAMEIDAVCGAFATLGMTGSAMLGAILLPYLCRWVLG
jgi:putative effector of murein hydrolase